MRSIVCPYCVNWRCAVSHEVPCPLHEADTDCFSAAKGEMEPFWPDGSVAELTQREPCNRCAAALDDYKDEQHREWAFRDLRRCECSHLGRDHDRDEIGECRACGCADFYQESRS